MQQMAVGLGNANFKAVCFQAWKNRFPWQVTYAGTLEKQHVWSESIERGVYGFLQQSVFSPVVTIDNNTITPVNSVWWSARGTNLEIANENGVAYIAMLYNSPWVLERSSSFLNNTLEIFFTTVVVTVIVEYILLFSVIMNMRATTISLSRSTTGTNLLQNSNSDF